MTTPAPGDKPREGGPTTIHRIKVSRAQKIAAQYLVELAEKNGEPVRPAYRAIANAK